MGLDVVEIVMDLEDAFCVALPADARVRTVGDLEDLIWRLMQDRDLTALRLRLDAIDGSLGTSDAYAACRAEHPWLPTPSVLTALRGKLTGRDLRTTLLARIQAAERFAQHELVTRTRVREIIAERLCLTKPPNPDDRLVDDLGCG